MRNHIINTSIIILLCFITVTFGNNGSTEIKQTYRFKTLPDDGSYTLFMNDISGNLIISGHEGSGGLITIKRITFGVKKKDIPKIHKKANIIVTHLEEQNLINIIGDKKDSLTKFIDTTIELDLPKHINLDFKISGGDISLNMINGESILRTLGGDILIQNSEGEINSQTNGGTINIRNSKGTISTHSFGGGIEVIDYNGKISSSTIGGDILLSNINGNLNCQSSGGSINLKNIQGTKISCRTSGGQIIGENLKGEIILKCFGGDTKVNNIAGKSNLYSSGGNMKILSSQGPLIINCEKGNIEVNNMVGSIEAMTSSGDISVDLAYDSSIKDYSIDIETHSGNITASIPKSLPANIENIVYQTTSPKAINSEIVLKITIEHDKIIGTRTIAGGTIPFNLKAHHGSITIKDN